MAAAAVLMAGMRRMAVDGLEGGDAAGHDELREASGDVKVAQSRDDAGAAQAPACRKGHAPRIQRDNDDLRKSERG